MNAPAFYMNAPAFTITPNPEKRSASQQRGFKHGNDVWISADVDFGGVVLEGVIVSPGGVAWPEWPGRCVVFSDPELKRKAEQALIQLLRREEARRMSREGKR